MSGLVCYHIGPAQLGAGSIIEPGQFGRVIRCLGSRHTLFHRESALEYVRQNEFPSFVSRLDCVFASMTQIGAMQFINDVRRATPHDAVYEAELVDPAAPAQWGEWNNVGVGNDPVNFDWARAYWRGVQVGESVPTGFQWEMMTRSPLRLLRRVAYAYPG